MPNIFVAEKRKLIIVDDSFNITHLSSPNPHTDELKNEQEKFKSITNELETTFSEMTGY